MNDRPKIDRDSYEIGYREGGNSASADWDLAFSEILDWEIDGLTPWQVVEKVKAELDRRHPIRV